MSSECYKLWTGNFHDPYVEGGKIEKWGIPKGKDDESVKSGNQRVQAAMKNKTLSLRIEGDKVEKFLKQSQRCIQEEQSKVSIPTASGIAVGATTLGVGGGIAGVYLIPKLIKLFVG